MRALDEVGLGGLAPPAPVLDLVDPRATLGALIWPRRFAPNSANTRSNAPSGSMQTTPSSRSGWATSRCSARWPPHEWPTIHARSIPKWSSTAIASSMCVSIVYGPPTVEGAVPRWV